MAVAVVVAVAVVAEVAAFFFAFFEVFVVVIFVLVAFGFAPPLDADSAFRRDAGSSVAVMTERNMVRFHIHIHIFIFIFIFIFMARREYCSYTYSLDVGKLSKFGENPSTTSLKDDQMCCYDITIIKSH